MRRRELRGAEKRTKGAEKRTKGAEKRTKGCGEEKTLYFGATVDFDRYNPPPILIQRGNQYLFSYILEQL